MTKVIEFFKEAWLELKQVTWLSPPQMVASTIVVLILVFFMAVYVFGVDYILQKILRFLV